MLSSGLRHEMAKFPGLEFMGEASTAADALVLISRRAPDLVVMDTNLPDDDGSTVLGSILRLRPNVKVVVFSGKANRVHVDQALQAGASAYVLKSSAVGDLFRAIDMVVAGQMYVSPEISVGILESYRATLADNYTLGGVVLTGRDKRLLNLIVAGERNKEIALTMEVSLSSAETFRARLKKKLACKSTAQLVAYAIKNKITPMPEVLN
jgi:DNA-binding NarL/FixJ family response regulator